MGLKSTARKQYQSIVDEAAVSPMQRAKQPNEGWIATVRKTLGLSTTQLGRLVNRTRANISAAEQSERNGGATLRTMKTMAEAMGCRFVYAIVPAEGGVHDLIVAQARRKARALVVEAGTHMALEKQALPDQKTEEEVERIAREFLADQPSDFWADE